MKKLLLIPILCLALDIAGASSPEGVRFEDATFREVLDMAKSQNRLVFVDIYTDWCPPCKIMSEQVFTQKAVGEYFNANYINAKFDAEKGEGIRIASRYNVRSYPTFLLLDGDGRLIGTLIGGSPPEEFIGKIERLKERGGY